MWLNVMMQWDVLVGNLYHEVYINQQQLFHIVSSIRYPFGVLLLKNILQLHLWNKKKLKKKNWTNHLV